MVEIVRRWPSGNVLGGMIGALRIPQENSFHASLLSPDSRTLCFRSRACCCLRRASRIRACTCRHRGTGAWPRGGISTATAQTSRGAIGGRLRSGCVAAAEVLREISSGSEDLLPYGRRDDRGDASAGGAGLHVDCGTPSCD